MLFFWEGLRCQNSIIINFKNTLKFKKFMGALEKEGSSGI